uniref:Uncharacterized protein n=1 Tax=Oryza meridionalis TaxID=40149 RepID=A0A0E0F925_9ORYZ
MEIVEANPRMAMMRGCADGEKRQLHFERASSATKKMKTEEDVVLVYREYKEDGKKRKKEVKRLGKEEVERLLSIKSVTVPTLSDEEMANPVMLRAIRALRAAQGQGVYPLPLRGQGLRRRRGRGLRRR